MDSLISRSLICDTLLIKNPQSIGQIWSILPIPMGKLIYMG
jgi:hypothetical protein